MDCDVFLLQRKGCIRMKQVTNALKLNDSKRRIAVLRLELDYELATLYDAIIDKDEQKKQECVKKLEKLRSEMIQLKA